MTQRSFVYFILDPLANAFKVGKANDPRARLRSLSCAHAHRQLRLLRTIECDNEAHAFAREQRLHVALAPFRMAGEWFANTHESRLVVAREAGVDVSTVDARESSHDANWKRHNARLGALVARSARACW